MKKDAYMYRNEKGDVQLGFEFEMNEERQRRKAEFLKLLKEAVEDLEHELEIEKAN